MNRADLDFTKLQDKLVPDLTGWDELEHVVLFGNIGKTRGFVGQQAAAAMFKPAHRYLLAWWKLMGSRRITESGCWEWTAAVNPNGGYGHVRALGTDMTTHRLAWFLKHGWVPKGRGQGVFHKCDNPPCFNPDHLWAGKSRENYEDMVAKGRNPLMTKIKIVCPRGHYKLGSNKVWLKSGDKKPHLACRACINAAHRERWARTHRRAEAGV